MKISLLAIGALFFALPVLAVDDDSAQQAVKQQKPVTQKPVDQKPLPQPPVTQQPVPQPPVAQGDVKDQDAKAPVLPRMIVVKVKLTGKEGAMQEETEPTICELDTQKTDVTDEAAAKDLITKCEAQEPIQIPTEKQDLPEALQGCLTSFDGVAGEALDQASPNAGRWAWGFARGAGRYLYGHGFRGSYGHSHYRPWAYPSYGYYYGGYRYPYSYRYSYPYGGYRYHYYYNPYYRWY